MKTKNKKKSIRKHAQTCTHTHTCIKRKVLHDGQVQIYAVLPNKFGNKFKIKLSSCYVAHFLGPHVVPVVVVVVIVGC